MMLLKNIDILSPQITLFYKGSRTHSSIISGVLTIITFILIVSCSIYYALDLFNRQEEIPKVATFNMFIDEAELYNTTNTAVPSTNDNSIHKCSKRFKSS